MIRRSLAPLWAGVLVAASMPPWGWWPLSLLGFAVYGAIARDRLNDSPFHSGFMFGVGWFLPALAWMWFLTAPGYLVAVGVFAAMHGTAALVASRLATDRASHRTALIVCHGLAEAIRLSWPFGGVPLATLAIAHASGPLARLAPLTGVIGLGVVVMWLAMSDHRIRAIAVVIVACVAAQWWGVPKDSGRTLRVAVVQGGGEQGTHAIDTDPRDVFDVHLAATRTMEPDPSRDVVIWPENVINVTATGLFVDSTEYDEIAAEARRLDVPFMVGITEDSGPGLFTNAQVVVEPDGTISGRYDKVRRVPFGEYVPMRAALSALGAPTDMVPRDARPGDARGWLDVAGTRAAVAISWEVFFGGRVNEGVTDGASFIVNPTNGSSYTWTILQTQQVAASRLRAREQHRWVVQVAPTGFSAFVSPDGQVLDRTSISERAVVERTIALKTGRTPYSRLGNSAYIWALILGLVWLAHRRSRAIGWGAS